ncbi:MAG: hypothetical protein JW967_10115 [Dehalococcoidales bacterium]|nr:hypothetical protein [Dehalococcoidales bacterium]
MSITQSTLNGICPYFTMFPLEFPLRILKQYASKSEWVMDPFSGRGTTTYAARLLGLPSIGVDSSPVAVALTEAKLANVTPSVIISCANRILRETSSSDIPSGEFWSLGYHPLVLDSLCRMRRELIRNCQSDARKALRAVILGALHGPMAKTKPAYFSNQCTRTYAPKPRYAVRFWQEHHMNPPFVDVLHVIRTRAERYYSDQPRARGFVIEGDSRDIRVFQRLEQIRVKWIVTSPPYYGMRTYIPDQWLRNWFLGGPSDVDYSNNNQLDHGSPESFARQLHSVWENTASISSPDARMVIRFGGIADRNIDPVYILKQSFKDSSWILRTIKPAGSADCGRRQAIHFAIRQAAAQNEHDAWAVLRS